MAGMSAGQPARCTGTMARVRWVSTFAIVAAVTLPLSASTSAKTGLAPSSMAQKAEATNERGVTTTSSPGPMPKARSASSSASEPLASAMPWPPPKRLVHAASKATTSGPVHWLTLPERSTAAAASISSSA